jgi:hypothetical protein
MSNKRRWKFLNQDDSGAIKSAHGDLTWTVGKWEHVDGRIEACINGLHCSERIREAFSYVQGSVLARVEVKGDVDAEQDKAAYSDMRIIKAYRWSKEDSVALAVFAAELVIGIFEKHRPDDDRPRKAIEAAKAYLANPDDAHASASASAYAASASASAYAASAYAYAANASANAAAYAANAASAYAASAYAAYAYAASAYAAYAYAAYARKELFDQIEKWLQDRVSQLELTG